LLPNLPLSRVFLALLRGDVLDRRSALCALSSRVAILYKEYVDKPHNDVAADLCLEFNGEILGAPHLPLSAFPSHEQQQQLPSLTAKTPVTRDNLERYLELLANAFVGVGMEPYVDAFLRGMALFCPNPRAMLGLCSSAEWCGLLSDEEDSKHWTAQGLRSLLKLELENGPPEPQRCAFDLLIELLSSEDFQRADKRRAFCYFATSISKFPVDPVAGYIKVKVLKDSPLDNLPGSNTCLNQLKLPPYTTFDRLKEKLECAIFSCTSFEID
jgi:hypothetical protein